MLTFKVGDKAVYPAHGVVEVNGVEDKKIRNTKRSYYILKVLEHDFTVMVPIDNIETVGLRPIIQRAKVSKVYKILKNKDRVVNTENGNHSWNKRYREYAEKLKSGDIFEVAIVLKEINLLREEKELSFGEKRIVDSALSLLVKEISISKNASEEKISKEIEKLLTN